MISRAAAAIVPVVAGGAQDVQPRADRRERIAQLVRERGEEFVLAAIGFLQRLDGAHAIGDVDAESVQHRRLAVGAVLRAAARFHPPPFAGLRVLELELDRVVLPRGERLVDRLRQPLAIFGRDQLEAAASRL